jgi:retron-type reverse transcriptase
VGIFDFFRRDKSRPNPFGVESLHGGRAAPTRPATGKRSVAALEALLGMPGRSLRALAGEYTEFTIPKRTGGMRKIAAPKPELKKVQSVILRRILAKLRAHDAAMAFERRRSIVTHARAHAKKAVVVRIDVKDFFGSIREKRVRAFFMAIGWEKDAAALLTELCTYRGVLPQGAPTSPRLANLVSHQMDARLSGLAKKRGAVYTRYADDLTFSFESDAGDRVLVGATELILRDYDLQIHMKKKLRIRRRHQQQLVTGLVVNDGVRMPRRTRRWLRAVEHHLKTGKTATLSEAQMAGWRAFRKSIEGTG